MSSDNARTGYVWLDNFDRGVIETLKAVPSSAGYPYVIPTMEGVSAPPDFEGIPVYFAFPDENIEKQILPSIIVRRDSQLPAMSRWHLGSLAYRVAAKGARPVTVLHPITGEVIKEGFDAYEHQDQAVPYDLVYTIQIRARYRNNLRVEAMKMLRYVLKIYQPYTALYIKDSLGDKRSYDAFMEGPTSVDEMPDIASRFNGFNITLRVEGELDENDPVETKAVTSNPIINTAIKTE
jgi:hypothetical protein